MYKLYIKLKIYWIKNSREKWIIKRVFNINEKIDVMLGKLNLIKI